MYEYYDNEFITELPEGCIFVFGSNEAGRHGAGAAKVALRNFKAQYGVGNGITGQSYALPTKDRNIETLGLSKISDYIQQFFEYAAVNPEKTFVVTKIGCGLAGYTDFEIAPLFNGAPYNCQFHIDWKDYVEGASQWED